MKRAKSTEVRRQRAVSEKAGLLKNLETAEELKIIPLSYFTDTLAAFSGVAPVFEGEKICRPVSFEIRQGDRIALDGRNGAGKSCLLKLLTGQPIGHCGTISVGLRTQSVLCAAGYVHAARLSVRTCKRTAGSMKVCSKPSCGKWTLNGRSLTRRWKTFPPGRRKRLLIAKSLCEQAHLYVWDEPLNISIYIPACRSKSDKRIRTDHDLCGT